MMSNNQSVCTCQVHRQLVISLYDFLAAAAVGVHGGSRGRLPVRHVAGLGFSNCKKLAWLSSLIILQSNLCMLGHEEELEMWRRVRAFCVVLGRMLTAVTKN